MAGYSDGASRHRNGDSFTTARRRGGNERPSGLYGTPRAAEPPPDRVHRLRELARAGALAATAATAPAGERAELTGAAYDVVWPIVYHRVTRHHEQVRGHRACLAGVAHLADECLDRFHDDVEAVVDDLLAHAHRPVLHLEAWIASRLTAATVDGNRRRRGSRGALQRPRLPVWVADGLAHDPWLCALAVEILIWVGVPVTAGTEVWPLDAWARQRVAVSGDWGSEPAVVAREVEQVLTVMRRRPAWFDSYVERPLGAKRAPVAIVPVETPGVTPLQLGDPDDRIDSEMLRLAADAVRAIDARLGRGEQAEAIVAEVIRKVFGGAFTATLDRAPHSRADPLGGVSGALTDVVTLNRIVKTVVDIVTSGRR